MSHTVYFSSNITHITMQEHCINDSYVHWNSKNGKNVYKIKLHSKIATALTLNRPRRGWYSFECHYSIVNTLLKVAMANSAMSTDTGLQSTTAVSDLKTRGGAWAMINGFIPWSTKLSGCVMNGLFNLQEPVNFKQWSFVYKSQIMWIVDQMLEYSMNWLLLLYNHWCTWPAYIKKKHRNMCFC